MFSTYFKQWMDIMSLRVWICTSIVRKQHLLKVEGRINVLRHLSMVAIRTVVTGVSLSEDEVV